MTRRSNRRRVLRSLAGAVSLSIVAPRLRGEDHPRPRGRDALAAPMVGAGLADLARLAGRTLIVGFVGTRPDDPGVSALAEQIERGLVGGVILLERNVESLSQIATLTAALQDATQEQPSLIVAIDEEGGAVSRTEGKPGFSSWMSARDVAQSIGPPEAAREYYHTRAQDLREAGVTLNLALVVDVDINPTSPAIGRLGRSFSSELVWRVHP